VYLNKCTYICVSLTAKQIHNMTYSIQMGYTSAILIQENNGDESTKEVSLSDFFQEAQSLGFFPEGRNFATRCCDVTFDFYGKEKTIVRTYQSMLEADCFGTEDLEKIIKSFFDTFPQKLYWVKENSVKTLTALPMNENSEWRTYMDTSGESKHLHKSFINTEWSEYQTSKKTALEMLVKHLEYQLMVVKNQIENL